MPRITDGRIALSPDRLKSCRRARSLSQEALAEQLGQCGLALSVATVKRAERGRAILYRTAHALAAFYGVELEQLVGLAAPRPSLQAVTAAPAVREAAPMVGRGLQRDQFRLVLRASVEGRSGSVVLVRGVAGIGKTRLLHAFEGEARAAGLPCFRAQVASQAGETWGRALDALFWGLVDHAGRAAGSAEQRTAAYAATVGLSPLQHALLNELLGLPLLPAATPPRSYTDRRADQIGLLVAMLGAVGGPLLVLVDDVHWAGEGLVFALRELAVQLRDLPVVLVIAARPSHGTLDAVWNSGVLNVPVTSMSLSPLSPDEARQMAGQFPAARDETVQQFVGLAGGHPLFLEQLLLEGARAGQPSTLRQVVQARLGALSDGQRRAVLVVACAGGAGIELAGLRQALGDAHFDPQPLVMAALLRRAGPDHFCCFHELVADAATALAGEAQAREAHGALAAWFRGRDATRHSYHLGRGRASADALLQSAHGFMARGRYDDALVQVERALDLGGGEDFAILRLKAELLQRLEMPERSISFLQRARDLARAPEVQARLSLELAAAYLAANRVQEARRCAGDLGDLRLEADESTLDLAFEALQSGGPVHRVGVLHSLTGILRELEAGVIQATCFAIEEINDAGGLLGHRIEPTLADGASSPERFAEGARALVAEGVTTLFGCSTSSTRRRVRPVVEQADALLVYPYQYEGLECSPRIVYVGPAPNQQVEPAVLYLSHACGSKRFALIGSDYVYPHVTHRLVEEAVSAIGGAVVEQLYAPLGETAFDAIVARLDGLEFDTLVLTVVGLASNAAALAALAPLRARRPDLVVASLVLSENDLETLPGEHTEGVHSVFSYFEAVDDPVNRDFKRRFRARHGRRARIGGYMESAYVGVHLWARAVQRCGSFAPTAVREALPAVDHYAPSGETVRLHPHNNHVQRRVHVARVGADGEFHVLWTSRRAVVPEPYPGSRPRAEWDAWVEGLRQRWNAGWERRDPDPEASEG